MLCFSTTKRYGACILQFGLTALTERKTITVADDLYAMACVNDELWCWGKSDSITIISRDLQLRRAAARAGPDILTIRCIEQLSADQIVIASDNGVFTATTDG